MANPHPPPPPPPPPPPQPQSLSSFTAQYTRQFLTSVLSQRSPSFLPYSEDVKWLIRQHLLSLLETYPTFQPKIATFTHDDDRSVNLLQSDGTVPMVFQTVTYNIPVVIWLMETYPRQPPLVFVNPTRDMIVKRGHQFVNPSGLVSIPYLQNWVYPSSNLVYLVPNLTHYFGIEPPLYSQRRTNPSFISSGSVRPEIPPRSYPASPDVAAASPDMAAASPYVAAASPDMAAALPYVAAASPYVAAASPYVAAASPDVAAASPDVAAASPYVAAASPDVAAASPDVAAASPYVAAGSPDVTAASPGSVTEDPDENYRRNAVNRLMENVHEDVGELRKKREVEMEGMLNAQVELRLREEELKKGLREMQYEKEALEQQLQMVLMNTDMLDSNARSFNVDDAFEPLDLLSNQMLESTASDLAIEDVIYALDKAVQEGSVPVDLYLRNVRLLTREQFFHRATSVKVQDVQMQAHVASMASRAPPYTD